MCVKTNVISWFEDPDNPSLGPIINVLKFTSIWHSGRSFKNSLFFYILFIYNLLYLTNILLYMFYSFEFKHFTIFIQYSAVHLGMLKLYSLWKDWRDWERLVKLIAEIDLQSRRKKGSKYSSILDRCKLFCYFLTFGYCGFCAVINMPFILGVIVNNIVLPELGQKDAHMMVLFEVWIPFDVMSRLGRNVSTVLQVLYCESVVVAMIAWDLLVLSSMVVFIFQLKALRVRCAQALNNPLESCCFQNVVKCHQHYINILECYKQFNKLISPVMFVHLILVTVNYGVCITLLTLYRDNIAELITAFEVLLGVLVQMFVVYWVSSAVIVEGDAVMYGIFESDWVEASVRVRRAVLMLGLGMRHRIAFTAGPFNEISLATFITILRTSYSFYTLLSRRN